MTPLLILGLVVALLAIGVGLVFDGGTAATEGLKSVAYERVHRWTVPLIGWGVILLIAVVVASVLTLLGSLLFGA